MTNGFSVSFPKGDVFMTEAGRGTAKGAREVKLKAKAKAAKHSHYSLWPRLLIEYMRGREKRY